MGLILSIENTIGAYNAPNGFDADYQAVLDYGTTQGYTLPSASQQVLQNQLVVDLKAAGVWSKLDTFGVFATDGSGDFALIDWIRVSNYTAVNSPTFTVNQGFQGNGVSSYIDMLYNPSVDAVNLALDNNHIMAYNLNATATSGAMISSFGTSYLELINDNGSTRLISFNMSTLGETPALPLNEQDGCFISSRDNSANYIIYKNASVLATATRPSSSIANAAMRLLARSNNTIYGVGELSFASVGSNLSATEAPDFYTALNTYMTSI